jgi:hypothetical protein
MIMEKRDEKISIIFVHFIIIPNMKYYGVWRFVQIYDQIDYSINLSNKIFSRDFDQWSEQKR